MQEQENQKKKGKNWRKLTFLVREDVQQSKLSDIAGKSRHWQHNFGKQFDTLVMLKMFLTSHPLTSSKNYNGDYLNMFIRRPIKEYLLGYCL